jgi:putative hydrolase of the HAD superfamily
VTTRAVLLDALGTLVYLEPPGEPLRAELERRTGVDVGFEGATAGFAAEIAYYLEHHMEGRDPASLDALRDRCARELANALPVDGLEHGAVRAAMLASLRFTPFPDVEPALRELRRRRLTLVVASNWDCSLSGWLDEAGLGDFLDGAVSSAVVGEAKPGAAVFREALRLAAVRPDEAVHVGDSAANDLEGARAAGIRAVLLERRGRPPGSVEAIRSLRELLPLL